MRVFAGPNGSGKSTIVDAVRQTKVNNQLVDFGIYVNADDIAKDLRTNSFDFRKFKVKISAEELRLEAIASGLINPEFTELQFLSCYSVHGSKLHLIQDSDVIKPDERVAQVLAHVLRKQLLKEKKEILIRDGIFTLQQVGYYARSKRGWI